MSEINKSTTIEIWPSIARLIAISMIFIYHFLAHSGKDTHDLDFYGILIFSFLSGYLIKIGNDNRRIVWAINRYFSIMIPYWLVIIPMVIVNQILQYKPATAISTITTVLGGNLFLTNPVNVTAWYITFVLILYAFALLHSLCSSLQKIVLVIVGALFFYFMLHITTVRLIRE